MLLVIPGVLILLVGMFFLYSPSTLNQVVEFAGMNTTTTVSSSPNILSVVPYENYSYIAVSIPPNDTITSTFTMDPAGLSIFIMNSGNFTLFKDDQPTAPISSDLNASSTASITLTNSRLGSNNTFYLVIQNNSPARQASDVVTHYTITSQVSFSGEANLPLVPVILGLALIVVGGLPIWRSKVAPPAT